MDPWASFLNWSASALDRAGEKLSLKDEEGLSLDQGPHCDEVDSLDLVSAGAFSDFTGGFRLVSKFNNLLTLSVHTPPCAPFIQWPLRPEFLPSSLKTLSLKFAGSVDALLFFLDLGTTLSNLETLIIIDDIKKPFTKREMAGARYPPILTALSVTTCRFEPLSALKIDEGALLALPLSLTSIEWNGAVGEVDHSATWPLNLQRLVLDSKVQVDPSALPPSISHIEATLKFFVSESTFAWNAKLPNLSALISPGFCPPSGSIDAEFVSNLPQSVRRLHLKEINLHLSDSKLESNSADSKAPSLPESAQHFINQLEELQLDLFRDPKALSLFPSLVKLQTADLAGLVLPSRLTTLIVSTLIESIATLPSTLTTLMANGGYSLTPSGDPSKSQYEMLPPAIKTLRIGKNFTSDHATTFNNAIEFLSLTFDRPEDDNQQLWDSLYLLPNLTSLGMAQHSGERPLTAKIPTTLKILSFASTNVVPFDWWKTQLPLAASLENLSAIGWSISPNYLQHLPPSLKEFMASHIDSLPDSLHFASLPRGLRSLDIRNVRCGTPEAREAMQAFQGYSAETLRALPQLAVLKIPGLSEFMDVHMVALPRALHEFSVNEEESRYYYSSLYLNLLHPHHMRVMDSLGLTVPKDPESEEGDE